jgi:hypothetical protein
MTRPARRQARKKMAAAQSRRLLTGMVTNRHGRPGIDSGPAMKSKGRWDTIVERRSFDRDSYRRRRNAVGDDDKRAGGRSSQMDYDKLKHGFGVKA